MLIDCKVKFIINCMNTLHKKFRMTESNRLIDNDFDEIIDRKNYLTQKKFHNFVKLHELFPMQNL